MIRILPGCIVCGLCEALAPAVLDVQSDGCVVRPCSPEALRSQSEAIHEAVEDCPVSVILVTRPESE